MISERSIAGREKAVSVAKMKFVAISDTHGDHHHLTLPPGDVIIHAGDISANGKLEQVEDFIHWFDALDYPHKILIAGNHDWYLDTHAALFAKLLSTTSITYLNDSGVKIDGVSLWGSPITPVFFDWAFQREHGEAIASHWRLIPENTQILITHGPPHGIMDLVPENDGSLSNAGCKQLLKRVQAISPVVHLFGHIHEGFGEYRAGGTRFLNVCSMNSSYRLQNPAVVFEHTPDSAQSPER